MTGAIIATSNSPYCTLRPADLESVRWLPGFWGDRFAQCRDVTLPLLYRLMADPEQGHALTNLRIAAGLEEGEFAGTHWQDEWVYKWLEAAAYIYDVTQDESLDQQMDEIIDVIARAQQPDGYIATQTIVRDWPRLQDIRHHELYVMGHLITAACIHHRVTGKTRFFDVAIKTADYLHATFIGRDPALAHFDVNPSYIMATVELYRSTGDRRYLDLATVFIDMRGSQPGGTDNNQDRVPLREEHEVVGHMVMATYLYAGAADAYLETGDETLREALDRLWSDLIERKMYVQGGVCPQHRGLSPRQDVVWEAADAAYALPNSTAYNETCAQIGDVMWNWRMLAMTGDAAYADVMETSLYNSVISGIGLDGASWFYTNVLRWYGADHPLLRNDAHGRFQPGDPARERKHVCCPSNLLRLIASLHGYAYSLTDSGIWLNLYGASTFDGSLPNGTTVALTQRTDYPWNGVISITIDAVSDPHFAVHLRIPQWADGATLAVNDEACGVQTEAGSYARVERAWAPGDTIELVLPMRARLVQGHPRIEATRNQVAVARGPVVYCLESPDLPDGAAVAEVIVPSDAALAPRFRAELLGGVVVLKGDALVDRAGEWTDQLYRELPTAPPEPAQIVLIPYYAWGNRGTSEMSVWLPLRR